MESIAETLNRDVVYGKNKNRGKNLWECANLRGLEKRSCCRKARKMGVKPGEDVKEINVEEDPFSF